MRWCGKLEAGVADRRAHAVAALADRRVGQAHHREVGQAERDVHLDVDRIGVDAEDGGTAQAGEHDAVLSCKTRGSRLAAATRILGRFGRSSAASLACEGADRRFLASSVHETQEVRRT